MRTGIIILIMFSTLFSQITRSRILNWRGDTLLIKKIGVANNTPSYPIDVTGDVNITGVFRMNGTPLSFSGTGTGIHGSGTANYVPKFTGDSTLGNGSIQDNGNIGIGKAPSSYKFDVNGAGAFSGDIISTGGNIGFGAYASNKAVVSAIGNGKGMSFYPTGSSGGAVMTIDSTGRVGVGATAPEYQLHVNGLDPFIGMQCTRVGGKKWYMGPGAGSAPGYGDFQLYNASDNVVGITIKSDGLTGIGLVSPTVKLDVNGSAKVKDTFTIGNTVKLYREVDESSHPRLNLTMGSNTVFWYDSTLSTLNTQKTVRIDSLAVNNVPMKPVKSTATLTWGGFATGGSSTLKYTSLGYQTTIMLCGFTGTSNANTMTTSLPSACPKPSDTVYIYENAILMNNGVTNPVDWGDGSRTYQLQDFAKITIAPDGNIACGWGATGSTSGFTASGNKGIYRNITVTYINDR